jgi:hypothetical protein
MRKVRSDAQKGPLIDELSAPPPSFQHCLRINELHIRHHVEVGLKIGFMCRPDDRQDSRARMVGTGSENIGDHAKIPCLPPADILAPVELRSHLPEGRFHIVRNSGTVGSWVIHEAVRCKQISGAVDGFEFCLVVNDERIVPYLLDRFLIIRSQ